MAPVENIPGFKNSDEEGKVSMLIQAVEGYHKEKNKCHETCVKFGERIGMLEQIRASTNTEIKNMKEDVRDMKHMIQSLTSKVFIIVGIGSSINFILIGVSIILTFVKGN